MKSGGVLKNKLFGYQGLVIYLNVITTLPVPVEFPSHIFNIQSLWTAHIQIS